MSGSRNASIPWHHTISELVAFPLASEAALRQRVTSLDPRLKQEETWRLWRAAERELIAASPSLSIDELVGLRDELWFKGTENTESPPRNSIDLANYLRGVSKTFLRHTGALAIPDFTLRKLHERGQSRSAHDRSMWRWLSFALPSDLLLASLGQDEVGPERIYVLSPLLEQQLRDGGFAEPHLHLSAALDFPLMWVSTLNALAERSPRMLVKDLTSPGAILDEGGMLGVWLMRSAIARYLLGAFLDHGEKKNLASFLQQDVEARILEAGRGLVMLTGVREAISGLIETTPLETKDLDIHRAISNLQSVYIDLTAIRSQPRPRDLKSMWATDPLASFLPGWTGQRSPEVWLIARALEYLETEAGRKDRLFALVFWQVVRVRCLFYRHVVQRPMTPGLQWFIRFFARMSPLRSPIKKELLIESALKSSGQGAGLRSLELRISPEGKHTLDLIKKAEQLLRTNSSNIEGTPRGKFELGFVVHFQRERGGEGLRGKPAAFAQDCDANPSESKTGYRHAQFYRKRREETLELRNFLTENALSLEWLRGLDLCSDEVGVPVWVMAPLLRHAREAGAVASRILQRMLNLHVPGCRIAVHAGEDFVHLLTGLRRLDEAIDGLRLQPGDRLGHALSLGLDVENWAKHAGNVVMPAEDRLLDLAWEWNWRSRNGGQLTRNRHLLIEREIADLSKHIFKEEHSPLDFVHLVEDLYSEYALKQAGFPNGPVPMDEPTPQGKRANLLVQFLTRADIYSRGRHLRWVEPAQDVEALEELQQALRQKVAKRELVVEVNPSSNLLIGHLADISKHPLWRLRPPKGADGAPAVTLIIGSDDPITFATELRQEYQLVYDTLILGGCSTELAEAWIDSVRRASLTSRFTVPWSGRSIEELRSSDWSNEQRRNLVDPP
ncbi:hypothetical protein OV207_07385 [Corallococcus sp. BB11-1]|uniref:hypothetical protein n=1 Tax=Corallococcus sp. BB11-1 TaxID=2996783 RepID=UPI00227043EF|nr:hypothetical protein [Corallococcus sp. BB11-1]MCY1031275.1 hypothetical protein [Corallococcus sp. BB11-1]